jgi:hypothetical protein
MTCRTRSTRTEPTGLGLGLSTHHHVPLEDDDEPRGHPSPPNWAIERLTTLSSQLKSAVELVAAQSTISALESKVILLETPVRTSQA